MFLILFLLYNYSPISVRPTERRIGVFHNLCRAKGCDSVCGVASDSFRATASRGGFVSVVGRTGRGSLKACGGSALGARGVAHKLFSGSRVALVCFSRCSGEVIRRIFIFGIRSGGMGLGNCECSSVGWVF